MACVRGVCLLHWCMCALNMRVLRVRQCIMLYGLLFVVVLCGVKSVLIVNLCVVLWFVCAVFACRVHVCLLV